MVVQLDPELFKQVLLNLISNAIKYSDEDCDISLRMQRNHCIVEVADLFLIHFSVVKMSKQSKVQALD